MGYVLKQFDYSIYFDYTGYVYPTLVLRLFLHTYLVINQLPAEPHCAELNGLPRLAVQQMAVTCSLSVCCG